MSSSSSRYQTAAASIAATASILGALFYFDIPSWGQQKIATRRITSRCYSEDSPPSLTAFKALVEQITTKETYSLATTIEKNIPVYDCKSINLNNEGKVKALQDELYHILTSGPGVFVLKNFFTDLNTITQANSAYTSIISSELASNGSKGDHFATAGTNSRIWNSFSKHCLTNPSNFLQYFSNPWFQIVCEAYLGPAYRITSQVNIVKPGGKAQVSHRDYHLGFQTAEQCAKWPKGIHNVSALLTLQGAVAHSDMPLESGPTRFLPYSQKFEQGFMAYRKEEFNEYFLKNWVSLALKTGDAVFFSPGLHHAAGENLTKDFERSANLIQVSSAFGKPMETIDTLPLIEVTFEELVRKFEAEGYSKEVEAFVNTVAEGYPFPTNLDRRPPAPGGMAPESEQDVVRRAVLEMWRKEDVVEAIKRMREESKA